MYDTALRRAYNRETYDGMCSSGKLRTVFPTVAYTNLVAESARERGIRRWKRTSEFYGSRALANDFRDKFPARLYEQPRDFRARGTKTHLRLFREKRWDFSRCVCACVYVPRPMVQFIRDKSGRGIERDIENRIQFRGRKNMGLGGSLSGRNTRARKCQFKKKATAWSYISLYKFIQNLNERLL